MPHNLRSFSQDRTVVDHRLKSDTLRRVAAFARPYRGALAVFLLLIVIDTIAGAATPLIFKAIIDQGIQQGRTGVVVGLSGLVAGLAVLSAINGLAQRWFSARIGEGLIHDLRTQVFDHVQRMPIGFFSRAQTGALVSRLNSDVQGAQQAFTSTLSSVVGNVLAVVTTLAAMFVLSWQITLLSLALLPLFVLPARWTGKRLAEITREKYRLNGEMGQMMTERFNVSGALLVKLFGQPETESDAFSNRAGRVRDIGVTSAMYSRVVMAALGLLASLAGGPRVRRRRRDGDLGLARHRHARRPHRLPQPPVRTADLAVQRAGRRDDDARQLRAGARGARPGAVDRRRRRSHAAPPRPGHRRARRRPLPLPDGGRGLAGVAGGRRPTRGHGARRGPPRRLAAGRARPHAGPRRPVRRRQVDDRRPGVAAVRPDRRRGARRRRRPARDHAGRRPRHRRRRRPGRPHVPRHPARQPGATPSREPPMPRSRPPCGPPRSGTSSPACPTASTPSSATAATACPAARSSGSPSPACSSRTPAW